MPPSSARRRTWIAPVVILVVMALTASLTWWIAGQFRSPKQIAAEASAPPAGPITAKATRGPLDDAINARAQFGSAQSTDLHVPAGTGTRVVTADPLSPGQDVSVGAELLEISGRPLFAVDGGFPYYRDLAVGDTGPDVRQWQATLRSTGFTIPRSEDGTVGTATADATARFYRKRHATPPAPATSADATQPSTDTPQPAPATPSPSAAAPSGPHVGDIVLPQAEVLVIPPGAQRVAKIPQKGTVLGEDATITLSGAELAGTVTVPALDAVTLSAGMAVVVTPDGAAPVNGILGPVPPPSQNTPASGDATTQPTVSIPLQLSTPIPTDWDGKNFLVSIVKQHVADDAILVPSAALDQTGGSAVFLRGRDGAFTRTPVTVLGTSQGMTALQADDHAGVVDGAVVRLG